MGRLPAEDEEEAEGTLDQREAAEGGTLAGDARRDNLSPACRPP